MSVHLSKNEFLYGSSDYAKEMRQKYGDDYSGYKKFFKAINPMEFSRMENIQKKEALYKAALANLKANENIWNRYKNNYEIGLANARARNNGMALNATQKQQVLRATGDGAVQAQANFKNAQSEVDYTLSLYNEATHSGMNYLS